MQTVSVKKRYFPPDTSADFYLSMSALADSNTEPIEDDDNDILW